MIIVNVAFCVLGTVANSLVIVAYYRNRLWLSFMTSFASSQERVVILLFLSSFYPVSVALFYPFQPFFFSVW